MEIKDKIYGKISIDEPVILDLIATRPFQRLKKINQYGGVNFVYKDSYQTSRYEHSIGVWHAAKKLGGDLETQVAALLHDVGHFTFSHLVDMAKMDEKESDHEFSQTELEGWEEIEVILQKNQISIRNTNTYKLIKTSLPDIGVDRLDYAIRDLECVLPYGDDFGKKVLNSIELLEGEIIFTDPKVASEFAQRGNRAMWHVIYDPQIAVVYQSVIEILRDGINDGWLTRSDLLQTDDYVFELFKAKQHEYDPKYFRVFTDRYNTVVVDEDEAYDFKQIKLKARYFDPRVKLAPDDVRRVSEIDSGNKKDLEKYVEIFEERKKGINIKLVF